MSVAYASEKMSPTMLGIFISAGANVVINVGLNIQK